MNVDFIVQIPVANALRFTLNGVPDDVRASYDKRRYHKTVHATTQQRRFPQPLESTDTVRVQYYSNYPVQRVRVIDCDETVYQTYTPSVAIQYRNKKYRADARFSSINDKLFIYFTEGQEYSDEDFLVPGDTVSWLGRLPNIRAVAGDILRFDIGAGFQAASIQSIAWSPSLQAQGYLTDLDYTLLSPVDGLVEVTYNEKDANLYSQLIPLNGLLEGEYFVELGFGVAAVTKIFYTEPLDVKIKHPKTLAIEYRHNGTYEDDDIWSYIYLSDWTNIIRFPTDFYKLVPAGEVDQDIGDFGLPRMLRAVPFRQVTFEALNIPSWIADKLMVIFSHDSKRINEYYWENENLGEFDMIDRADLGTYTIQLKQVDDRTNFITAFTEDVTANWTPSSFTDLPFGGTVVEATFNTNTIGTFEFLEDLPDWINPSQSTFQNGDVVEFTIDENAQMFEKDETLTAASEEFPGLEAPISFHQLYDDSEPEFLEVSSTNVVLGYEAGASETLNVSTSGPYTKTYSGAHTFTATNPMGGIDIFHLVISEPTENDTGVNRTGVVRLTLNSNPAIFVDINVTQEFFVSSGLEGSEPTAFTFPSNGGGDSANILASAGTEWQASSSQTWCIVDTGLHVGNGSISVFVNGRDLFIPAPRFAQITIVNVNNPSDTLTIIVQQN